jgi:hypothetical protein
VTSLEKSEALKFKMAVPIRKTNVVSFFLADLSRLAYPLKPQNRFALFKNVAVST